jgi:hypothetical protein
MSCCVEGKLWTLFGTARIRSSGERQGRRRSGSEVWVLIASVPARKDRCGTLPDLGIPKQNHLEAWAVGLCLWTGPVA